MFNKASAFNQDVSNWNTGAVTNMYQSKCTLSPSLWPRLPLLFCLNVRQLEFHSFIADHNSDTFCCFVFVFMKRYSFVVVCGGLVFLFFVASSLQCFDPHLRSIRTCRNGIRGR